MPVPLPSSLVVKNGSKMGLADLLARYLLAGIGDLDQNVGGGPDVVARASVLRVNGQIGSRERQRAAAGHRITGVDDEVQQNLVQLRGIARDRPQLVRHLGW